MMGALSAWRRTVRPTAVVVAAAAATVVLASSAAAATQASHRHKATGRTLQTLFSSVRVFTSASDSGGVKGKLAGLGTGVSVLCWTTGAYYKDTTVWYEISAPFPGYVSAFSLNAHYAPAVGMPHCLAPAFREEFNTLEANLKIRRHRRRPRPSPATSAVSAARSGSTATSRARQSSTIRSGITRPLRLPATSPAGCSTRAAIRCPACRAADRAIRPRTSCRAAVQALSPD